MSKYVYNGNIQASGFLSMDTSLQSPNKVFATDGSVIDNSGNDSRVDDILEIIPTQATSGNPLADKAFVNSSVQTATANFRGNWNEWSDVPTDSSLYPVDYSGSTIPTVNDYLVVVDASGYTESDLSGTWRFKYSGSWDVNGKDGWNPEYQVNETPLTSDQLAALNSGINSSLVGSISSKANDSEVVHIAGAETITGEKTFTSNLNCNKLIVESDGTYLTPAITSPTGTDIEIAAANNNANGWVFTNAGNLRPASNIVTGGGLLGTSTSGLRGIKMQGGDSLIDSTSHYLGLGAYGNKALTISDATSTGGAGAVYPASDRTIDLGTDSQRFQTVKAYNIKLNSEGSMDSNLVTHGNEVNIANGISATSLYVNYRGATNNITTIGMYDGKGNLTTVKASKFVDSNGNQATIASANTTSQNAATKMVTITSAAYTALSTKDANTLYIVI